MSKKKAGGSTRLGRDSISKRLGVKIYGGQEVNAGGIIVRQRGTKFHPGENTKKTGDDSIIALKKGTVEFIVKNTKNFTGKIKKHKFVNVK